MANISYTNDESFLILCNEAKQKPRNTKQHIHALKTGDKKEHDLIHLTIGAIQENLADNLPNIMKDLLEIATLVYAAGQITCRGGLKELEYGYKWHRQFDMAIPVREYDIWTDQTIKEKLEELISFVSGESYRFFFSKKPKEAPAFFDWTDNDQDGKDIQEVVLFSGGMDSFCGAVSEIMQEKKKIALVSHCSDAKMIHLQQAVFKYIKENCRKSSAYQVPVHIFKGKNYITKDTQQRNRSFLYATLGALVAQTLGLHRVRFYENGIISCNLPFDGQTWQARRTRTTHPKFLKEMSDLISAITQTTFTYENQYAYKTRADVIQDIVSLQHQQGLSLTRSCAKSRYTTPWPRHDGVCSQCIDRRFATIAAQCQEYDPQNDYKINIFTDELENTQNRTMATGFAYLADKIESFDQHQFYLYFSSDLLELVNYIPLPRNEAIKFIFNLYKRYAKQFNSVLDRKFQEHPTEIRTGNWPHNCLLSMVAHQKHKKFPQLAEQKLTGTGKHGRGKLDALVQAHLNQNPKLTAKTIAEKIGTTTSAAAVRQTKAWKSRNKT